jgi:hypothetical protein
MWVVRLVLNREIILRILNLIIMEIKILILLLFLGCVACSNPKGEESVKMDSVVSNVEVPFDKNKWTDKKGEDYPHRDGMLKDLMENQKLKTMRGSEVLDLLGQPDRIDSSYFFYRVAQKRVGFVPLHTKTLVIKLAADSTVDWVKIHE